MLPVSHGSKRLEAFLDIPLATCKCKLSPDLLHFRTPIAQPSPRCVRLSPVRHYLCACRSPRCRGHGLLSLAVVREPTRSCLCWCLSPQSFCTRRMSLVIIRVPRTTSCRRLCRPSECSWCWSIVVSWRRRTHGRRRRGVWSSPATRRRRVHCSRCGCGEGASRSRCVVRTRGWRAQVASRRRRIKAACSRSVTPITAATSARSGSSPSRRLRASPAIAATGVSGRPGSCCESIARSWGSTTSLPGRRSRSGSVCCPAAVVWVHSS
jgi:hypothetical protein